MGVSCTTVAMTDIQLPVLVIDLFSVFGMTDSAQILIALLSLVLGVLLVLIMLIVFRGRPSDNNSSRQKGEASDLSRAEKLAVEPIIPELTQPEGSDALAAQSKDKAENSELMAKQVDDFQIFKRPRQKSVPADLTAPSLNVKDQVSTAENLRLIEKEMVRLRDLYQSGHITREIYVDETRSLYYQARELSSIP